MNTYTTHRPTTGLTPSPSPRGEGSSMLLKRTLLGACAPQLASPPTPTGLTPNPSPRGEGSDMSCCGVVGFVVAKRFVSFSPRGGIEVILY